MDFEERDDTRGFTQISTEDLRQLAAALNNGTVKTPLQPATLSHAHLGHLAPGLGPFMGLDRAPLLGLIRVALAERRRAQARTVELVWSGPDAGPSYARYTRLVVPEMLDAAAERATIAGYSFDEAGGSSSTSIPLRRAAWTFDFFSTLTRSGPGFDRTYSLTTRIVVHGSDPSTRHANLVPQSSRPPSSSSSGMSFGPLIRT